MSRRDQTVCTASALLLGVLALGAIPAPVALAGSGSATCRVRNVTQRTSSGSFRVVVTLAHDGDRLEVRGTCRTRGIEIDKDLVIRGMGDRATLTGQHRYRVLRIAKGAVVTLRRLVLTHGWPVRYDQMNLPGGGAVSNRGTLTLVDSFVTKNEAYFGGGIYNIGTLTLIRSKVSGGADSYTEYYIYGTGGGIYNTGQATLEDSLVSDNHTEHDGGGILNTGRLTLRGSRVSGNSSYGSGSGGIENSGSLILVDSRVSGNRGNLGGGIGNAGTARLIGSTVADNSSFGGGGGIFNGRRGTLVLSGGSSVTGNANAPLLGGDGGGIENRGTLTLRDSTVTANATDGRGGGIFNHASGTVTLRGSASVTGNTPDDCVGTPAC